MKKLLLSLICVLLLSTAFTQSAPKSYHVTDTRVSTYSTYTETWVTKNRYDTPNMWLTIAGMDVSANGDSPMHLRLTKSLPTTNKNGAPVLNYSGYSLGDNQRVEVAFYMSLVDGSFTSVVVFWMGSNPFTCIEFNLE